MKKKIIKLIPMTINTNIFWIYTFYDDNMDSSLLGEKDALRMGIAKINPKVSKEEVLREDDMAQGEDESVRRIRQNRLSELMPTKLSTREVEVNEKKIGEDMQPVIQPRRRIPLLNDPPMASHNDNIMVITDKKWDGKEKQVCNKVSGLFL